MWKSQGNIIFICLKVYRISVSLATLKAVWKRDNNHFSGSLPSILKFEHFIASVGVMP